MSVYDFLSRLHRVHGSGPWLAECPAHEDRKPSLRISESDGRILAHCFAGCSIEDVVGSVGLTLSDLMPERAPQDHFIKGKKYLPLAEILEAIALSAMMVAICAADVAKGKTLTNEEKDRLFSIAAEIQDALEMTGATKMRDKVLNTIRQEWAAEHPWG